MTTIPDRDYAAMLAPDILPEPKTEEPRQRGRRVLPNNDGKPVPHTHVTTVAQTVADAYGLRLWEFQRALWGVCQRPDLVALVQSVPVDDNTTINEVMRQGKIVGAVDEGANLGTSWHNIFARVDRGEDWQTAVPEYFHNGIRNYLSELERWGLTPLPQYIERTCRSSLYDDVEGTFDNIFQEYDGSLVIGDKKTKEDISRITSYPHAMTTQLALYASCDQIINYETGQYEPMPPVRRDYAIIIFLDRETHKVKILQTDGLRGIWSIGVNMDAREWRKTKNLITEYTGPGGKTQGLVRSVSPVMDTSQDAQSCQYCGGCVSSASSACISCGKITLPPSMETMNGGVPVQEAQGNYAQIDALIRDTAVQEPIDLGKVAQLNTQAAEIVSGPISSSGGLKVTDVTKEVVDKIIALSTQVSDDAARANSFSDDNLPIGECPNADPPVDPAAEAADMASSNLRPVLQYRAHLLGIRDLKRQRRGLAEEIIRRRNELRSQPALPLEYPAGQPVTNNGVLADISQAQSRERLNKIWTNWVEVQKQEWTTELNNAATVQLERIRTGATSEPPF